MMAAALFGAMTLGACVDNQESQSVTDIRDAKTEELKSLAALNNAQAEVAKIMANAEASLMAAEAQLTKALAEQVEAETALLEVEAELAAVKVQMAQAQLESALIELERQAAELEAEKAEYEQRIAVAQAEMVAAEAKLEVFLAEQEAALLAQQVAIINATKSLETAQKVNYIGLFNEYNSAVNTLNQARTQLLTAQNNYTAAENGIITTVEGYLEDILGYTEAIVEAAEAIANLEAKAELFAEYVTLTDAELEEKIAEKMEEYDPAVTALNLARLAYNRYFEANPQPEFPEDVTLYENTVNNLYNGYALPYHTINLGYQYLGMPEIVVNYETNAIGYYLPTEDPWVEEFYPIFEKADVGGNAPYVATEVENEYGQYYYTYAPGEGWSINEANFEDYLENWGKMLEVNADAETLEANKKALETAKADAVKAVEAYEKAIEAYNNVDETIAAAKKVADEAKAAADKAVADAKAVKDAEKDVIAEEDALHKATSAARQAQKAAEEAYNKAWDKAMAAGSTAADKAAAQAAYEAYQEATKKYEAAVADWQAGQKKLANYGEVIAAAEKAATDAVAKAAEAAAKADATAIEAEAEAALHAARSAKDDAEAKVKALENAIANSAQNWNIEDYEAAVEFYTGLQELAAIAADEETYAEYNAWGPAVSEAEEYIAYMEAHEAYWAISGEIDALRDAYAADDDYEAYVNQYNNQIAQLEADIEYYTAAIEALEAAIEDPANDKKLADLEALVEMAELKVAAAQKAADEAKAKLDAALAE